MSKTRNTVDGLDLMRITRAVLPSVLAAGVVALVAANVLSATTPKPVQALPQDIRTQVWRENADVFVRVLYPKVVNVAYPGQVNFPVTVEVVRKTASSAKAEIFSTEPGLKLDEPKKTALSPNLDQWSWNMSTIHEGGIAKLQKNLTAQITYDLPDELNKGLHVDFVLEVDQRDFEWWHYSIMLTVGVLLSYVLTEGRTVAKRLPKGMGQLRRPLAWVAVAIISTPFLYAQLRQAATGIDTAPWNLFAAIGFGFGFDQIVGRTGAGRS